MNALNREIVRIINLPEIKKSFVNVGYEVVGDTPEHFAERVRRGDLGRPRFFASTFSLQVRAGNIRTKPERGGGPLLDLGIYCVNAARSFASVASLSPRLRATLSMRSNARLATSARPVSITSCVVAPRCR